jgi:hypothetical protein
MIKDYKTDKLCAICGCRVSKDLCNKCFKKWGNEDSL